jgi:hypothetical protein
LLASSAWTATVPATRAARAAIAVNFNFIFLPVLVSLGNTKSFAFPSENAASDLVGLTSREGRIFSLRVAVPLVGFVVFAFPAASQ